MYTKLFSASIFLQLALSCKDSTTGGPTSDESATESTDVSTESESSDGITPISKPFYLYHDVNRNTLNLDWYNESFFNPDQKDFTGKWSITPRLDGDLVVENKERLDFVPKEQLLPNQTYTIQIEEIQSTSSDTIWRPSDPDYWTQTITTPPFKVLGISFGKVDRKSGNATIIVNLSHPIPVAEVKSNTTILLNGKRPRQVQFSADGSKVSININAASLLDQTLEVSVKPLNYSDAISSEEYSWKGELGNWKKVHMYGPYIKENATGFAVEYICDDSSVSQRSWYWDYDISFDQKISQRCNVDLEQLKNNIDISPPIRDLQIYPRRRGFALVGDFKRGNHNITIPAGITTQDGGGILETIVDPVLIPHRSTSLRFHSTGRYMPVQGWTNLHFQHRNIDEIELSVRSVSKSNLHHWAQDGSEDVNKDEGKLLVRKNISLQGNPDEVMRSTLNLKEHLPTREAGIYQVTINDKNSSSIAHLTVQVTDMNLITKRYPIEGGGEVVSAWVLNSRTNKPMSNIDMSIVSAAGEITTQCKSDTEGGCTFTVPADELNNNSFALYAEKTASDGNPELAYLIFDTLSVDLGLYDASGTTGSDKEYRIAAHTDRGAYRPGDTVQLFGLIRGTDNIAPKTGLPVHLTIKDGRGQVVRQQTLNTSAAGVFNHTLNLADHSNTGTWTAEWYVKGGSKSEYLGEQRTSFKVENLVPERLSVRSKFAASDIMGGGKLTGTIDARYLFGKSAEGADFQVRCDVESTPFSPKSNGNYTYGSYSAFEDFHLGTITGTLDENGQGDFTCPYPERLEGLPGMATVVASVDVMESGSGRSTKRTSRLKVHPTETYLGLQIGIDVDDLRPNVDYPVSGIVVDWQGNRIKTVAAVEVQLSEIDYAYNWTYNEESGRYEMSTKRFELPLRKETVPVDRGLFSLNIRGDRDIEEYRIRAQAGSSITFLDLTRSYDYWYSRSRVQTPDPFRPDNLDIRTPTSMNLRETVTATTVAPYPGRILWTVENEGIIRKEWIDVEQAGEVDWQFSLAGQPFQNTVYVTALMVKDAHSDSELAYMPSRAFGTQPIKVRSKQFYHNLSIDAPTEVQANTEMTVALDLGGSVEKDTVAMVAVVDEGLLSLTNFKTPDPSDALFPKMPLAVNTAETVGWGISSPSMDSAPAGGGADGGDARRKAKVVKPVALWSGLVDVASSGKASTTFSIPQYSGSVRVMAWTVSPTRFASADENVLVRDPLTMQATLPRFLTEGDIFDVPVFITNLSGEEQTVTLSMEAESTIPFGRTDSIKAKTIEFLGKDSTTVKIKADEQKVLVFKARALAESGFATFTVNAQNSDASLKSEEKLEVPFSSKRPTVREFQSIQLSSVLGSNLKGTADITPYLKGWSVEDTVVWSTNNPYSESLVRVRDLIRYPYGCVEQTSSSLRPLISAADILQTVDPTAIQGKPIEQMVKSGVERLASMQTSDGGIGYWPGARESHPWGTAYATHVLLDAKDAGHPVMDSLVDGTISYLENVADGSYDYGYYRYYMPTTQPYAHYLLARVGKGKPVAIRALLESGGKRNYESEFMLKTALYLSGDRTYESELKSLTGLNKISSGYDHWSFRSNLRTKGLILALHQEMFGNEEKAGETLAFDLHNTILSYKNRYISTQAMGWSTYAMAQRVLGATSWKAPTLTKNNKALTAVSESTGNRSWNVWDTERNGNQLTLKGSGSDGFLILSTEGVRADGQHEYGDKGIKVTRFYRNMDGSVFNPETQNLGDEVVVVLSLTNTSGKDLHELALVDRIPAGWEIQNPNLNSNSINPTNYVSNELWQSEYLTIQDNQIEIFGDLSRGQTKDLVYVSRATTSGTFTVPPVSIEAMYDDTIWSRHKGSIVTISGAWDGKQL